jgi:hypothetical protein
LILIQNHYLMLAGPRSAKLLARLLADPDSFTVKEEQVLKGLEEIASMEIPFTAEQWAALSDSSRFYLGVACLRAALAQQGKELGSN